MALQQPIQFTELANWMALHGHSRRTFAEGTGLDKMTVQRLLTGRFKRFNPDIVPVVAKFTDNVIDQGVFSAFFERRNAKRRKGAR